MVPYYMKATFITVRVTILTCLVTPQILPCLKSGI